MLQVIISADFNLREEKRKKEISKYGIEPVLIDDTSYTFSNLQDFLYPSLFSEQNPVIHAKYLIEEFSNEITKEILSSLVSSPTIFILEERVVPASFIKIIKKEGAIVHELKSEKQNLKKTDIFSVTNAITNPNKKDRWLIYRNALESNPAEALIGILYWKLKDLISKPGPKNSYFRKVYRDLMLAHKDSWQRGFPLELAIEKTILKM